MPLNGEKIARMHICRKFIRLSRSGGDFEENEDELGKKLLGIIVG